MAPLPQRAPHALSGFIKIDLFKGIPAPSCIPPPDPLSMSGAIVSSGATSGSCFLHGGRAQGMRQGRARCSGGDDRRVRRAQGSEDHRNAACGSARWQRDGRRFRSSTTVADGSQESHCTNRSWQLARCAMLVASLLFLVVFGCSAACEGASNALLASGGGGCSWETWVIRFTQRIERLRIYAHIG